MKPSTTRRSVGATEMILRSRRIRRARSTERPWVTGTRAMATMTKSKTFQPERKKERPRAKIFSAISTTKIDRHRTSRKTISGPATAIAASEVSSPRTTALNRITQVMKFRVAERSSMSAMFCRIDMPTPFENWRLYANRRAGRQAE